MDGAQHELKRSALLRQRRHDGVLPLRAAGSDWVAEPEVWAGGFVGISATNGMCIPLPSVSSHRVSVSKQSKSRPLKLAKIKQRLTLLLTATNMTRHHAVTDSLTPAHRPRPPQSIIG